MRRLLLCLITPLFAAISINTYAVEAPTRDPAALKALTEMGQFIQKQKRFSIDVDSTMDRVLDTGQLIQFAHQTRILVERPNLLRIKTTGSTGLNKEVFYDGKTFTIFDAQRNFYAIAPAPNSIEQLLTTLDSRYQIQLPLTDLFHWGKDRSALDSIEEALVIGEETINGKTTNHYAFRQGKLDWQIWIEKGKTPVPVKLMIVNRADEARPQYIASLNFKTLNIFEDNTFRFIPPQGARQITLLESQTSSSTQK